MSENTKFVITVGDCFVVMQNITPRNDITQNDIVVCTTDFFPFNKINGAALSARMFNFFNADNEFILLILLAASIASAPLRPMPGILIN